MIDLGIEHATARALYEHFKGEAGGGQALSWRTVLDWKGIWTREASPFFFWDPDQASTTALPTAKLTSGHERLLRDKLDNVAKGVEFDPRSNCEPAGMQRWIVERFLNEPDARASVSTHSTLLYRASRNRGDLAEDGRGDDRRGRLGLRPAGAGGALVH
jgi:hypothetical protein